MNTQEVISSEESAKQNQISKRYASIIGVMPSSFSLAVKDLMLDEQEGLEVLSERSEFQVGRVLRGATALAVLYWASKTFCDEKMPKGWIYSSLQISRFYRPSTLAAILAYTYLFKRMKRVVNPEEWQFINDPLQKNIELVGLLGWHIPEVGPTVALLGGGMINVAFSCFSAHDRKGFADYRRLLKMKKQFINPAMEISHWGCSSIQVATQILLQSGFGVELTHKFIEGFREPEPLPGGERAKGPFVAVRRWLEEIAGATSTDSAHSQNGRIGDTQDAAALMEKMKMINKQGSLFNWIDKGAQHISPELTPDLLLDGVIFK